MTQKGKNLTGANAVQQATFIQDQAAHPGRSVVLKAGAGSGKTTALINRFLRLCIEFVAESEESKIRRSVPVHPRSILAITFTRKAAVEIRERLLDKAVDLAKAEAEDLVAQLRKLFGREPTPQEQVRAAGLYEQILEHPHGLKIGTIHYFCQLILGRFAAEAGLDPGYTVLEDTSELVDEALDAMEKELALAADLSTAARRLGKDPGSIRHSLRQVFNSRMRLERWCEREAKALGITTTEVDDPNLVAALQQRIKGVLFPDLQPDQEPDLAAMIKAVATDLDTFAQAGMDSVLQDLGPEAGEISTSAKDKLRLSAEEAAGACKAAAKRIFAAANPVTVAASELAVKPALEQAREVLLTKSGKPRIFFRGRKNPELTARFQELVVAAGSDILAGLRRLSWRDLYIKNATLLHLGLRTLAIYRRLKQRDKTVDFQDLEALACRLMSNHDQAMSLLFRLDDSITHIMIDEFQDTNYNQWDILWPLVEDFLGGGSDQTESPTVFFVGDVKQSIYSFRGAEPIIFQAVAQDPAAKIMTGIGVRPDHVAVLSLPTNFRSLPAITAGVGQLFSHDPLAEELGSMGVQDLRQHCARDEAAGEFYILPPFAPADDQSGDTGDQLAATAAAELVQKLVNGGTRTWIKGSRPPELRALAWRDVLVLFRARTRVGLYEDAFRLAGIPISPSGRGALASSREVQDLLALLRWLVWPEDDIALATVLRSPLFRLNQHDLQLVLARRGLLDKKPDGSGYRVPRGLWSVLSADETDPITGRAVVLLKHWRKRSGYVHCHDLLRLIYHEGDVLERYQAATGDQAVYNLMRIHDLTLGREMASLPTVRQLIQILERAARTGGQEEGLVPDGSAGGRVRFMTIHGAKGLEAPVVLFVDADAATGKEGAQVILDPDDSRSALLFSTVKLDRQEQDVSGPAVPDPVAAASGLARERDRVEEANLEYVAMTRARDRLYILGGDKSNGKDDYDSPLRRILQSAEAAADPCLKRELPPELIPDFDAKDTSRSGRNNSRQTQSGTLPQLPVWTPSAQPRRLKILTPSAGDFEKKDHARPATQVVIKASGSGSLPTGTRGIQHGLRVHALLEAAARLGQMPPGSGLAWDEAEQVFNDPQFRWIFHTQAEGGRGLSEAPVICERPDPGPGGVRERITGVIDRLVLRPERVDIIDYKTNRCAAQVGLQDQLVEHYRPQLAMYQEVVRALYPQREVFAWLLFTDPALAASDRLSALA